MTARGHRVAIEKEYSIQWADTAPVGKDGRAENQPFSASLNKKTGRKTSQRMRNFCLTTLDLKGHGFSSTGHGESAALSLGTLWCFRLDTQKGQACSNRCTNQRCDEKTWDTFLSQCVFQPVPE